MTHVEEQYAPVIVGERRKELDDILSRYPTKMAALLPALWIIQNARGWVSEAGMAEVAEHNRRMVLAARQWLSETLSTDLPAPESMIGSLAAVVLPDAHGPAPEPPLYLDQLQETLFTRHHIEVPIILFPRWPKRLVRVSAQIYNDPEDYQRLGRAICEELER